MVLDLVKGFAGFYILAVPSGVRIFFYNQQGFFKGFFSLFLYSVLAGNRKPFAFLFRGLWCAGGGGRGMVAEGSFKIFQASKECFGAHWRGEKRTFDTKKPEKHFFLSLAVSNWAFGLQNLVAKKVSKSRGSQSAPKLYFYGPYNAKKVGIGQKVLEYQ